MKGRRNARSSSQYGRKKECLLIITWQEEGILAHHNLARSRKRWPLSTFAKWILWRSVCVVLLISLLLSKTLQIVIPQTLPRPKRDYIVLTKWQWVALSCSLHHYKQDRGKEQKKGFALLLLALYHKNNKGRSHRQIFKVKSKIGDY